MANARLLLLLLLNPLAAFAQPCALEPTPVLRFAPSPPVSSQYVLVTVGSSTLAPASSFVAVSGTRIDVTVFGTPRPDSANPPTCLTAGLGPLASGTYDVNFIQSLQQATGQFVSLVKSDRLVVTDTGRPAGASVVPAFPVPSGPVSIRIRAGTSSSPVTVVSPHTATRQGNLIRVEGCYRDASFSVPGVYTATAGVPALPAGRYRVEYHRTTCDEQGALVGEPKFLTSFDFDVVASSAAWPPAPPVMPVASTTTRRSPTISSRPTRPNRAALESRLFTGWEPIAARSSWYPPQRRGTVRLLAGTRRGLGPGLSLLQHVVCAEELALLHGGCRRSATRSRPTPTGSSRAK